MGTAVLRQALSSCRGACRGSAHSRPAGCPVVPTAGEHSRERRSPPLAQPGQCAPVAAGEGAPPRRRHPRRHPHGGPQLKHIEGRRRPRLCRPGGRRRRRARSRRNHGATPRLVCGAPSKGGRQRARLSRDDDCAAAGLNEGSEVCGGGARAPSFKRVRRNIADVAMLLSRKGTGKEGELDHAAQASVRRRCGTPAGRSSADAPHSAAQSRGMWTLSSEVKAGSGVYGPTAPGTSSISGFSLYRAST